MSVGGKLPTAIQHHGAIPTWCPVNGPDQAKGPRLVSELTTSGPGRLGLGYRAPGAPFLPSLPPTRGPSAVGCTCPGDRPKPLAPDATWVCLSLCGRVGHGLRGLVSCRETEHTQVCQVPRLPEAAWTFQSRTLSALSSESELRDADDLPLQAPQLGERPPRTPLLARGALSEVACSPQQRDPLMAERAILREATPCDGIPAYNTSQGAPCLEEATEETRWKRSATEQGQSCWHLCSDSWALDADLGLSSRYNLGGPLLKGCRPTPLPRPPACTGPSSCVAPGP